MSSSGNLAGDSDSDSGSNTSDVPELARRPSQSILRRGSRTDLLSAYDSDDDGYNGAGPGSRVQQQHHQPLHQQKKRASFSLNGPERFEFAPGSAPGSAPHAGRVAMPPSVTRRRPGRTSLRSSGASQPSLEPSSASVISDSSWSSAWSHKARRLIPCCIDRHKQRGPVASFFVKLLCCPYEPTPKILKYMRNTLESWFYGVPFLFFTLLLLFGESIQYLWCPKSADLAFNYLYTIGFAFFIIDVVMRCYVSPAYFVFEFCGLDYRFDAQGTRRPRPPPGGLKGGWGESFIKIGSFMFWCDIISTVTLLYDITWINTGLLERTGVTIPVDVLGVAIEGETLNDSDPVERNIGLLVAVGRTARIARFIRATTIVKASSKFLNCMWLPDWAHPSTWIRRCRGWDSDETRSGTILEELAAAEATSGRFRRKSSSVAMSQAAISAIREEEEGGIFKKVIGVLTCKTCSDEKQHSTEAARKIQKAWRVSKGNHFMSSVKKNSLAKSLMPSSLRKSQKEDSTSSLGSSSNKHKRAESQVGTAMRELTGQRVALGIILSLVITVLFTYVENNDTPARTMVMLHNQTSVSNVFKDIAIGAARSSAIPNLFKYEDAGGNTTYYDLNSIRPDLLREREILEINVTDGSSSTMGTFSVEEQARGAALVRLLSTIFIILIWLFGVTSFAGPVMTLVVVPIERMVRLLSMLMQDPLGYQSSNRYMRFVDEEDDFLQNTTWSKDVLKGMETNFLMSTILRVGSLMKVGFGAAGVEIIRESLEAQSQEPQKNEGIFLNSKGSIVKCIFLFCDIRQFTDATESLQEEVFVFTNQIASVIHSICNSYGGSANKNVGDAFLMSWLLEDESEKKAEQENNGLDNSFMMGSGGGATNYEADKALYSVVKICIALYYDTYYIEMLKNDARERLLKKIGKRHGAVVQMGFGLHMGKAVQGAIGSERKLDATYISEAVEFAEFLESSTKKYGLKMLMSDAFWDLLDPVNRRRCRKIDQLLLPNEEEEEYLDDLELVDVSEKLDLYTYDMDIEALWRDDVPDKGASVRDEIASEEGSDRNATAGGNVISSGTTQKITRRMQMLKGSTGLSGRNLMGSSSSRPGMVRRSSLVRPGSSKASDISREAASLRSSNLRTSTSLVDFDYGDLNDRGVPTVMPTLVLPPSNALYTPSVWNSKELKKIRVRFSDGLFYQKFNEGLQAYYSKDWEQAKRCFRAVLDRVEDGPSRYFMMQMDEHDGVPPRNFLPYGRI
mmetsp:Transcript_20576/g.44963  ORF Transcript_20576/g.44963 Transcript_20576/m.44963 type:complete len:1245 (+) Transcript_20576:360-4094(+)